VQKRVAKKVLKKVRVSVTWIDRDRRKSEGGQFYVLRGVEKVLEKLATTGDQTGKLIECRRERGEWTVEEGKSARGTGRPKSGENEREELEEF
jgi:hypothetical protein